MMLPQRRQEAPPKKRKASEPDHNRDVGGEG